MKLSAPLLQRSWVLSEPGPSRAFNRPENVTPSGFLAPVPRSQLRPWPAAFSVLWCNQLISIGTVHALGLSGRSAAACASGAWADGRPAGSVPQQFSVSQATRPFIAANSAALISCRLMRRCVISPVRCRGHKWNVSDDGGMPRRSAMTPAGTLSDPAQPACGRTRGGFHGQGPRAVAQLRAAQPLKTLEPRGSPR